MKNTLAKSERLSSERRIDALFSGGRRGVAGPLKFCWTASTDPDAQNMSQPMEAAVSVLFSVPKKSFKKAWKRNLLKRRMRESYRLSKHTLVTAAQATGKHIDIALICAPAGAKGGAATNQTPDFKSIDDAVAKILGKILERC